VASDKFYKLCLGVRPFRNRKSDSPAVLRWLNATMDQYGIKADDDPVKSALMATVSDEGSNVKAALEGLTAAHVNCFNHKYVESCGFFEFWDDTSFVYHAG
jgi:hypothetical protein